MSQTQTAPNATAPDDESGQKEAKQQQHSPLRTLLRPIKGRILTAVALQGLASALGLVPLICLVELARTLLADNSLPADGAADTARVWLLVGVAVGASVAALAAGTASTLVGHLADNDMQLSVRRSLAHRMSRVPLGWFTGRGSGRVKKAVHDDIEDVHSLVAHTLPDLASVVTVPLVALVYLFAVDWRLALVSVLPVAAGIFLFSRAMAGGMAKMAQYAEAMNRINSSAVEFVDGIQVVKHFGGHRRAHERFTRAADDFADFFLNWSRSTTPVTVGSFLLLSAPMATVVTVLAGVGFALAGWTEPVSVVAFALLAPALCAPMNVIGSRVQQTQAAGAAAARVRALLRRGRGDNALKLARLEEENSTLRRRVGRHELVWKSEAMRRVMAQVNRVAPTASRVCILGETGTGKELIARVLHFCGKRKNHPFVALNCSALTESLLESELFGHEKGAFTSAVAQKKGKFEQAEGGTLFMDEIGDMSLSAQAKVLRALQENKITRVGGEKDIKINVEALRKLSESEGPDKIAKESTVISRLKDYLA